MTSVEQSIREKLFSLADEDYRDFHSRLMPNIKKELVVGVRTHTLRKYAKSLAGTEEREAFLSLLPHKYYDENNLHAFLVEQERDKDKCFALLDAFLPHVDNWATCDMMRPAAITKDKPYLFKRSIEWISSFHTYTKRYGIKMLMEHFLDDDFAPECLEAVADVSSDEYYVNMAVAWFFATALTKRYDESVKYIEERRLSPFCHNKTISKACDSFCIDGEKKAYLKKLRF